MLKIYVYIYGNRGNVNKDIIRTNAGFESVWFPYMNNGISIICNKLTIGQENEKKHIQVPIENMQIINGCQTVNALYSAKYGESTRDNFFIQPNVMVRIYEIDPMAIQFKTNIIKATNNQNSVKSYS